jgi:CO/xanthine dehydrogenase FAD-binding subunit
MITEYHRPETIEEALTLLARPDLDTRVLGGGLTLNQPTREIFSVVDIQKLGLNRLEARGDTVQIGAAVTLQALIESELIPAVIKACLVKETGYNRRQVATVAGSLVSADGRSPFAAVMMAYDPILELLKEGEEPREIALGDFMVLRGDMLPGRIITRLAFTTRVKVAYEQVARSPVDRPIVSAAVGQWSSKRTRAIIGGWGDQPRMVADGPGPEGAAAAARDSYMNADDQWASGEYRSDVAGTLVERCINALQEK